jgi:hypothetical protein
MDLSNITGNYLHLLKEKFLPILPLNILEQLFHPTLIVCFYFLVINAAIVYSKYTV